jgi:hypothetical protein
VDELLKVMIPDLLLVSEANRTGAWQAKHRRRQQVAEIVAGHLMASFAEHGTPALPQRVRITRVASRSLDTDNLARACKGVRDAIASRLLPPTQRNQSAIWGDDSDPRIEWEYGQQRGPASVVIEFEPLRLLREILVAGLYWTWDDRGVCLGCLPQSESRDGLLYFGPIPSPKLPDYPVISDEETV